MIATERNEAARAAWREEVAALAPETLVFLDETSTHTRFTRRYGRALRGQRVVGHVPRTQGPNVSCLMAISASGVLAPLAVEGAIDSTIFVRWLKEWLLPSLPPGTTIICDNLKVHRNEAVRPAIEAATCHLRYLPPYSPDFNPIEQVFSQLKAHLRTAASRTVETLMMAIGEGLDAVEAEQVANCYRHCGYKIPTTSSPPL